jgi:predicted DsbA family dithiol-disulfide isomerase
MSETRFNIVPTSDRVTPTAMLHIEVIADFVCPFCFLGKRRLDEALGAVQGPSETCWYPFQLNPDIPPEGQPFETYLTQRFGGRDNIEPILEHLVAEGRAEGIKFEFDRIRHVPNTLPAHQVGMPARDTRRALGSDQARQVVVTREAQVRGSGLNAAPGFLINRRLLVVGAQPTDNLVNAFDRAMFGEGTDSLVSPALH